MKKATVVVQRAGVKIGEYSGLYFSELKAAIYVIGKCGLVAVVEAKGNVIELYAESPR